MKKLLAILAAVMLLLTVLPMGMLSVSAAAPTVYTDIASGETKTAYITSGGQYVYYRIVPILSATYTFSSSGSYDTYGYLLNSSGSQVTSNDDGGTNNNFSFSYSLTGGSTYYLAVRMYNSATTGSFSVTVTGGATLAGDIAAGETKTVSITTAGSSKYYRFVPNFSGSYTFASSGSYDTYGYLLSASGTQLASNDDGGTNSNFSITYSLTAGTTYYLQARMFGSSTTGSFSVTVTGGMTYVDIVDGETKTVSITTAGSSKYYRFVPAVSGNYTFASSGSYDTYGYLLSASGTQLASDDDDGDERNFSITYSLTAGTTYYLQAKMYNSSTTGSFSVTVTGGAVDIAVGETKTVSITTAGSSKYYRFVPAVSGSYTFASSGSYDTYGYLLSATGTQLASDDDDGDERNFSITYSLTAGTSYYLQAKMYYSDATGSFSVTVTGNGVPTPTPGDGDVWDGTAASAFGGGTGTSSNPYLIYTAEQLAYLAQRVNGGYTYSGSYFKLMSNLNLNSLSWNPIGNSISYYFSGNFDGNYHTVYNMKITGTKNYAGLFGYVSGGSIAKLGIENADVDVSSSATMMAGLLCGDIYNASVSGCYVTGEVNATTTTTNYIGLMIGRNKGASSLTNCYGNGDVHGETSGHNVYAGGLYGGMGNSTDRLTIDNCYFVGTVYSDGESISFAGGIGGICAASVSDSFTVGSLTTVDSYSIDNIVDNNSQGWGNPTITNCYYNLTLSQGSSTQGTYATLSNLQSQSWITTNLGWDFTTVWEMGADYPVLKGFAVSEPVVPTPGVVDEWDGTAASAFGGGTGTSSNPYLIYTAEQLAYLAQRVNAGYTYSGSYFKLMSNLNLNSLSWNPIGTDENDYFSGYFDGNYHTIYNLSVTGEREFAGLFGLVKSGSISHLGVVNGVVDVYYDDWVLSAAVLVGGVVSTTISQCYATGSVSATSARTVSSLAVCVSLLCGTSNDTYGTGRSTIRNCYASGDVFGEMTADHNVYAGGLIGDGEQMTVENSYFSGDIVSKGYDYSYAGGISGVSGTTVRDSFAVGTLTAQGGTAGLANIGTTGYSTPTITNCYYNLTLSHGSSTQGTYATLSNLQSQSWIESNLDWDFATVWEMGADYPVLRGFAVSEPVVPTPGVVDEWDGTAASAFGGGTGTSSDPYLIYTAEQLAYLAQSVNGGTSYSGKYFKLMNNLNLNNLEWTPIGKGALNNDTSPISPYFSGNFDGNYHTIYGLRIDNGTTSYNGLFGYVYGGTLSRLGIVDAYVYAYATNGHRMDNGALAGKIANSSAVSQCFVENGEVYAFSTSNPSTAGVLLGNVDTGSTVENCYAQGTATGNATVGGLVGSGFSASANRIRNCYAQCEVNYQYVSSDNAGDHIGGVVGFGGSGTKVSNSFFTGTFSEQGGSSVDVASIIAYDGTAENCYYSTTYTNLDDILGTSTSDSNFRSQSWITTNLGWDFTTVWEMGADYPVLKGFAYDDVCEHVYESEVTDPTCTENGYTTYTCSVCGDSYVADEVDALGHSYESEATDPTCGADGMTTYTCSVCGDSYTETIPATGMHTYDHGCDTECNVCGYNRMPGEHEYEFVITTEPTCGMDGVATYTCSVCGDNYTEGIPATGMHIYSHGCDADCDACGYIRELGDHAYAMTSSSEATCGADGLATYTCSNCGDSYSVVIPATGSHVYDHACDNSCNVCGAEREVGDHVYTKQIVVAATCGTEGECAYTCSNCGDSYTVVIPATGAHVYDNVCDPECNNCLSIREPGEHAYVANVTTEATCGTEGVRTYTCNHCGDSYTEAIPATGMHVYANGCDANCDNCGFVREVGDHVYTVAVTTQPTCGTDGVATYTCANCGDSYTATLPASGEHTYSNSCDAECNGCGQSRPVDGHLYDHDYDATCNVCGAIREVSDLPASAPTFVVDGAVARPGQTFTIAIRTENNIGIVSLRLDATYDSSVLELVSIVEGDFKNLSVSPLENNPFTLNWVDAINPNNTTNGVVALVTFRVKEGAAVGNTDITLTYNVEDVYDSEFNNVLFRVQNGTIRILDYTPGDANGDGTVNNKDLGLIQQAINEWNVSYDAYAADVNADGAVNNKDLGQIQRYLSGWSVQLG